MKNNYLKKVCLLLVAGIWAANLPISSAPLSRQQASRNVQEFLKGKGFNIKTTTVRHAPLKDVGDGQESSPYYVFNIGDGDGFVIASGDDRSRAILGYADEGKIDTDSMPDGLKCMLKFYEKQIQQTSNNSKPAKAKSTVSYPVVEPMLTTKWGQNYPYNANCPIFPNTNERCPTGCVATAMAQIMFYHRKYSANEVTDDIPSYYGLNIGVPVNSIAKGTPIDWDNMLDYYGYSFTEDQEQAVANLMLYCGTSVEMNYYYYFSGAFSQDVPIALVKYFDYDNDLNLKKREDYKDTEWEKMIYEELGKGNPIFYAASSHAFVIDGHDGNGYVHINWGWNGMSDGHFLLTASSTNDEEVLDGYSYLQEAIFGAVPNGFFPRLTSQEISVTGNDVIDNLSSRTSIPVSLSMTVANLTGETHDFEQAIGLYKHGYLQSIVSQMGEITNMTSGTTKKQNVSFELESTLSQGAYTLVPLSRAKGSEKWRKNGNSDLFITLSIYAGKAKLTVGKPEEDGDIITFDCEEVRNICVKYWDLNGDGALSKEEAAAVTSLDMHFNSKEGITSFDELQYFTGLSSFKDSEFFRCQCLASVIIPPNVTSIGKNAFGDCNLKRIKITKNVTNIAENAFDGNGNLEDIRVEYGNTAYDSRNGCHALIETATNTLIRGCCNTVIPEDVVSIGSTAFSSCKGLKSLIIPNSVKNIGNYAFESCSNLISINIPDSVKRINHGTFSFCNSLEELIIPASVTSIGTCAFEYCKGLASIIIPSNVETIESQAFYGCTGLSEITLSEGVTNIEDWAFGNCSNLESITIPKSVTSIGSNPFSGCHDLKTIIVDADNSHFKSICNNSAILEIATNTLVIGTANTTIPEDIQAIGNNAFHYCNGLTSITIPSNVTKIGEAAFSNCGNLKEVVIMEGVTKIGEEAFSHCKSLKSVTIPSTVTKINNKTFYYCTGLESFTIPSSITSIGFIAFGSCTGLKSITIPSSVTYIYYYAFAYCSNLVSVTSNITNVFSTYSSAFVGCTNATLYVPKGLVSTYQSTEGWNIFSVIKEIPYTHDINGDGSIDISDVVCIVNKILGTSSDEGDSYDVNGDGKVDISDVVTLVNVILGKE